MEAARLAELQLPNERDGKSNQYNLVEKDHRNLLISAHGDLASTLLQVRQQWNNTPKNSTDRGNSHWEKTRGKRQKKNHGQHDHGSTRQVQNTTLAQALLQLLQSHQFNSDAHLANTVISTINNHGTTTCQQALGRRPSATPVPHWNQHTSLHTTAARGKQ